MGNSVRNRVVLVGALLGALLGLGAAYILAHRHENSGKETGFSARETISVGMDLVKLLRKIGDLASRG